jgi:RNA polymerase sigma factor (sigma-70 family)
VDRDARRSLNEAMRRLADGERAAFDPVFAALHPLFSRIAMRSLSPAEADDVAQSALLKLFARASEFDAERDALSFALGVIGWEIRTSRTRARRRREVGDEKIAALAAEDSVEDGLIAKDLAQAVNDAIGTLSAEDAATLGAVARGERPVGTAPATFRKRVERAMTRLRAVWKETHGAS